MIWLVVLTILKNTSQIGLLFPIYGKRVPNHQPEYDPFFAKSTVAGIVTWSMHGMIILNHRSKPPPAVLSRQSHEAKPIAHYQSTSTGWWYTYPSEKYEGHLG